MNWIVIGVGDIAKRRVIPAIQAERQSHLYGVVTRDLKKAAAYSADTRAWNDLDEALRDPAVEAVYVATPVFLHAPQRGIFRQTILDRVSAAYNALRRIITARWHPFPGSVSQLGPTVRQSIGRRVHTQQGSRPKGETST